MKKIKGKSRSYAISMNDCFWNMLCRLDEGRALLTDGDIQNKRGVYIFWDWNDNPIRIGKAEKVRNRILSYYTQPDNYSLFDKMQADISFISVIYTKSKRQNLIIELDLIKKHNPKHNYHHTLKTNTGG